ncbi:hypothetical protein K9N68_20555 [Kovacikia minuta CCNUW1]|uniref:hypothetical protein n=1 Tax=Kovacikia minuta TaxID=2931930 RepID=UPI001CCC0D3B|nr:hypothetical protein [Kovacikia minuta]UBF24105.1 hypothetical protein K9N68_20555 [Kovacikia minuta CCNUW1]
MWGKPTGGFKWKWYPAIAIAALVILSFGSAWVFSHVSIEIESESAGLEPLSPPEVEASKPEASPTVVPSPVSTPKANLTEATGKAPIVAQSNVGAVFTRQGALRISNPTTYPIRVALLTKKTAKNPASSTTGSDSQSGYDLPAHWDFDPQEGSSKGLIVSLPDRAIKVKPGDILVAFAQDGSRRYWGPYVVGATPQPAWSPKAAEWQLILEP